MSEESKETEKVTKITVKESVLGTAGYKIKTGEAVEITIIPNSAGVSE